MPRLGTELWVGHGPNRASPPHRANPKGPGPRAHIQEPRLALGQEPAPSARCGQAARPRVVLRAQMLAGMWGTKALLRVQGSGWPVDGLDKRLRKQTMPRK